MLRYVAGVSFPRSGHHLVERLMKQYFGEKFGYCEYYNPVECCKSFPCARMGEINLSKNHDFEGTLSPRENVPYLIQYRSFVPAAVSDFELFVRNGNEDTFESFRKFALIRIKKYRMFVEKWVLSDTPTERLIVKYEDLVGDPSGVLPTIISYIAPDLPVNYKRVRRIIKNIALVTIANNENRRIERFGVRERRKVEDFRYYDQEFFKELNEIVSDLP